MANGLLNNKNNDEATCLRCGKKFRKSSVGSSSFGLSSGAKSLCSACAREMEKLKRY